MRFSYVGFLVEVNWKLTFYRRLYAAPHRIHANASIAVYLNHGVHVALCSDDPAAFGNMGLSFDYFQVFVASEVNDLATLRQFVRDSITVSFV